MFTKGMRVEHKNVERAGLLENYSPAVNGAKGVVVSYPVRKDPDPRFPKNTEFVRVRFDRPLPHSVWGPVYEWLCVPENLIPLDDQ